MKIKIGAVGDIHSPRYLDLFTSAIKSLETTDFDLFILAGDNILKGDVEAFEPVSSLLKENFDCPIVSCFGNEDYEEVENDLIERFNEITFLNDDMLLIEIKKKKLGLVATRGSLDRPTFWQAKNIPEIRKIYSDRIKTIEHLLDRLKHKKVDHTLLISHYPPTYKTMEGENPKYWPVLGSKKFEKKIIENKFIDVVIHAHLHRSKITKSILGNTVILNVSLPASKKITTFELPIHKTLLDFV